ncbi:hypothetical protein GQ44DRAFT_724328 [Phaeosphaeriaceae sp. PMI808]|nr:hypothetical protein GQ44DRAFT_724328 [Phaeosphaeriaceae sp. PMI808]
MDPEKELIRVNEAEIGLDRSNITQQGQIEIPGQDAEHTKDDGQTEIEAYSSSNLIHTLKERKHHVAIKIRKTLHISKESDEISSKSPVLANTAEEESDSRLVHKLPVPDKHTMKDLLHNPVDTVKSKVSNQGNQQVAANIAAKEIPHGQEVDLVNAHDAVKRARTEHEKLLAIQDVTKLMKERQSTYARWTLDRHVTKIRVLPRQTLVKKSQAHFQKRDREGQMVMDWNAYGSHLLDFYAHQYGGQYIGYGCNPPKPSKETIMPNIERLIVSTSPLQEFIMTTRRVYRWENRAETTKYLVIYLILWYMNLLLPGILSAFLYLVLERRVHGNTLEDLREDIKHREDTQQTALSLNEFIEKRGNDKWADEIVEVVGPWLMIQLADLANLFESLRNFYEWRKPVRTGASLAVLAGFIVGTAMTPVWLLVKLAALGAGFTFFALFPLAVNFPEYRLLVSPAKRLLWNIPTHAEWAIKYIQAEGTRVAVSTETDTALEPSVLPIKTSVQSAQAYDYGFYKGHHDKAPGHLIISVASCRFVSNVGHDVHFDLPYNQLVKIEKQDRIVAKKIPSKLATDSGKDLKLVTRSGLEYLLENMEQREEAFSQIVGFSHTTWQVVW